MDFLTTKEQGNERHSDNFSVISNDVFRENQLSFEAMGLLTYILSKPDNWSVNPSYLEKVTEGAFKKTGRDGVYSLLEELESAGFIQTKKRPDGEVDYIVSDHPCHKEPNTHNPQQSQSARLGVKREQMSRPPSTEQQPKQAITLPLAYVRLCRGNFNLAYVLLKLNSYAQSQNGNGWFSKSYKELSAETELTVEQVRYSVNRLTKTLGKDVIEVKIKKANGAPTAHYKIDPSALATLLSAMTSQSTGKGACTL